MAVKSQSSRPEDRKAQMEMQNKEIKETLSHIKNKILVMSGKGGVGKSSVAAYLSVALAKKGFRVGKLFLRPTVIKIILEKKSGTG